MRAIFAETTKTVIVVETIIATAPIATKKKIQGALVPNKGFDSKNVILPHSFAHSTFFAIFGCERITKGTTCNA